MQKTHGFSLVELSIVLVILGLLVGGVLGGQALIRSSELRNLPIEKDRMITATLAFRNKYIGLPGDITNATAIWGAAHATPATCITTSSTGTETCNGNGDGRIGDVEFVATYHEFFRAMQQLGNAGLLEGSFTGVAGPDDAADTLPGINTPRSRLAPLAYILLYRGNITAAHPQFAWMFPADYKHTVQFRPSASYGSYHFLTTQEAWSIDTKIDDGKPGTGNFFSFKTSITPDCVTTDDPATATYKFSHSGNACQAEFRTGF